MLRRRSPGKRRIAHLLPAAAVCVCLLAVGPPSSQAQRKSAQSKPTTLTGKLVSLETVGRNRVLTVEVADKETNEKETKQFTMTARTDFAVTATGDDGFLKAGQFVSSLPVRTNNRFFGKTFTVHVGGGKPKPVLAKAPKMIGVSKAAWNVAGQIVSREPDKQYPDYDVLTLRVGRRNVPVFLDKGYSVTVRLAEVEMIEPGAAVELQGRPAAGNRFLVTQATIKLAKPLKAAEFFSESEESSKTPEQADR